MTLTAEVQAVKKVNKKQLKNAKKLFKDELVMANVKHEQRCFQVNLAK